MNTNTATDLSLSTFVPADQQNGLINTTTETKSGAMVFASKRMSRKEWSEHTKLASNHATFNTKYRDYLKGHSSKANIALAAMEQEGLFFTGVKVRTKKDGTASTGTITFAALPVDKKGDKALLAEATKAVEKKDAQLDQMSQKLATVMAMLEAKGLKLPDTDAAQG